MNARKAEGYFHRSLARTRLADDEWAALAQAAGFSVNDRAARASVDQTLP